MASGEGEWHRCGHAAQRVSSQRYLSTKSKGSDISANFVFSSFSVCGCVKSAVGQVKVKFCWRCDQGTKIGGALMMDRPLGGGRRCQGGIWMRATKCGGTEALEQRWVKFSHCSTERCPQVEKWHYRQSPQKRRQYNVIYTEPFIIYSVSNIEEVKKYVKTIEKQ